MDRAAQKSALKSRLRSKASAVRSRLGHRYYRYRLGLIRRLFGEKAAVLRFWRSNAQVQNWPIAQAYLEALSRNSPELLPDFMRAALLNTSNGMTLVAMAEHPTWGSILGEVMADERADPSPHVNNWLHLSEAYRAAFLVATQRTGGNVALDEVTPRARWPETERYRSLLDSYGFKPRQSPVARVTRTLAQSRFGTQVRHRLLICESIARPDDLLPLMRNADKVTLISLADTFGKVPVDWLADHPEIGEVTVEHIRSRIPRFSPAYIANHLTTRDAARAITHEIVGPLGVIHADDLVAMEVVLADYLFFQRLKTLAVEMLLADDSFDHIALVMNEHQRGSGFPMLLSGVPGLYDDPRAEVVSASVNMATRAKLKGAITSLRSGPVLPEDDAYEMDQAVVDDVSAIASRAAERQSGMPDRGRPRVLFATNFNTAYNTSNGKYLAALSARNDCLISFFGRNAVSLVEAITDADGAQINVPVRFILDRHPIGQTGLDEILRPALIAYANAPTTDPGIAHVVRATLGHMASVVIWSQVIHSQLLDQWFAQMQASAELPDVVIISPYRTPQLAQLAQVARRYGVPSLILEAHGLNANYSRYTKVNSDYYGVISQNFRQDAEAGFGIPQERTFVIGTPRIVAPTERDPEAERAVARAAITEATGYDFDSPAATVSFFCQPSAWGHVEKVWRTILGACAANGIGILLKPHPEESPSRIARYLSLATELGQADRVRIVGGAAADTILASDLVLTGYSAAALDAAVLEVPVICVTAGPEEYPVDQHVIVGAPLVRSEAELSSHLRDFVADPQAAKDSAADFLRREPQFRDGPDQRLCDLVVAIVQGQHEGGEGLPPMRRTDEVPGSLFLDPPHPTFTV